MNPARPLLKFRRRWSIPRASDRNLVIGSSAYRLPERNAKIRRKLAIPIYAASGQRSGAVGGRSEIRATGKRDRYKNENENLTDHFGGSFLIRLCGNNSSSMIKTRRSMRHITMRIPSVIGVWPACNHSISVQFIIANRTLRVSFHLDTVVARFHDE